MKRSTDSQEEGLARPLITAIRKGMPDLQDINLTSGKNCDDRNPDDRNEEQKVLGYKVMEDLQDRLKELPSDNFHQDRARSDQGFVEVNR